jgi:hypothetical protein
MSLASKLSRHFSARVRERGYEYFREGLVTIRSGSKTHLLARVQGSRKYDVLLDLLGSEIAVSCDCPYYASEDYCKHIWAAIVAADNRSHLSAADSAKGLYMVDAEDVDLEEDSELDEEEDEEELDEEDYEFPSLSHLRPAPVPPPPAWRDRIAGIARESVRNGASRPFPSNRRILYIVDVPASARQEAVVLSLLTCDRKADGSDTRASALHDFPRNDIPYLPSPDDRAILSALDGARDGSGWRYLERTALPLSFVLPAPMAAALIPEILRTGRCLARPAENADAVPLAWDDAGSWQFRTEIRRGPSRPKGWVMDGRFARGEERIDVAEPLLVVPGGFVVTRDRMAPLAPGAPFEWVRYFRKSGPIEAPEREGDELLGALLSSRGVPEVDVPEELRYEEVVLEPRPCLRVGGAKQPIRATRMAAELFFDYGGNTIPELTQSSGIYDPGARRFLRRHSEAERAAAQALDDLGVKFRPAAYYREPERDMAASKLPKVIRALIEAGWHIEAEGKVFRRPGAYRMDVSSGVDWFELRGEVEFGDATARLPELLQALRRGEDMVRLDDGAYGFIPKEWLSRFGPLAGMGTPEQDHIRFRPSQAGLLDALLATQPEARCDETFARFREELRQFQGVGAAPQPGGFTGQLRDYQREGLAWMHFLRRFSFGGCLADDMGVGKTAQVLALLETRRELRAAGEPVAPSLVVVPRSLVFNWKQEAARFTPQLRVLDYTGLARNRNGFDSCDVVLTTYGTLRRDAARLKDVEFDYVVLDEAQAVKNPATESAKAVRLVRGARRLALSGTPVENHLGELWALFDFLNPGMLGAASVFKLAGAAGRNPDEDTRRLLAQALRPFILRRTKAQVARELPAKNEQTVYCEMEPPQRKLYNELRQHYRNALLGRIDAAGMAKSKIQVLEALLRLRQAACHPGLIDPKRSGEPSAKLDVLLDQLREVLDEGHKALVFSQFTSLLKIVRERLDREGVTYEYLDGATRDRQARVGRFQSDPQCPLFLISLKAGGLGLNLTAAEYVFLLDPWWNPAVEAQAVDRAHRIGQTRQVFAYRLIARDSVEEKVIELQKSKRDLADAIIGADNSLIRNLRREDLELLLS